MWLPSSVSNALLVRPTDLIPETLLVAQYARFVGQFARGDSCSWLFQ
ncbi:hypothetical protein SBA2_200002 [Acidobacteriia bacterium SbA2]|nr:hypothetical protein SBA2_200002 [Acidobacteriia bacterium SbA2]